MHHSFVCNVMTRNDCNLFERVVADLSILLSSSHRTSPHTLHEGKEHRNEV